MPRRPPLTQERLRQKLSDEIVTAMIPWVKGWVKTLGRAGAPTNNLKIPHSVRISAAKTGIELVTKFISSGTSVTGEELLKALDKLPDDDADNPDDSPPDPDGAEGGHRTQNPDLGGEEADLESVQGADGDDPGGVQTDLRGEAGPSE